MPGVVNRIAAGLLDFIGTKSMGRYPIAFAETISPVLDMVPWYVQTYGIKQTTETKAVAAGGALDFLTLAPSQGKLLIVRSFNVIAASGAGDTIVFRAALVNHDLGIPQLVQVGSESTATQTVGGSSTCAPWLTTWPSPTLVLPGMSLGAWVDRIVVGTGISLTGTMTAIEVNA